MSGFHHDDMASHIFSADPVASFKYEESRIRKAGLVHDPGLRRLMLALLEDAVGCFQAQLHKPSRVNQARFREALEWIASDADHFFSFDNVCENLGINARWFRKELFRWKQRKLEGGDIVPRSLLPKKGKWRHSRDRAQAPKA